MSKGLNVNTPIKLGVYAASRDARALYRHPPGKVINTFTIESQTAKERGFDPYEMNFVVNPFRKDLTTVLIQNERRGKLNDYHRSLFRSCFKNWY